MQCKTHFYSQSLTPGNIKNVTPKAPGQNLNELIKPQSREKTETEDFMENSLA